MVVLPDTESGARRRNPAIPTVDIHKNSRETFVSIIQTPLSEYSQAALPADKPAQSSGELGAMLLVLALPSWYLVDQT